MGWFFTGEDAEKKLKAEAKRQERLDTERKEEKKNKVYRFYLPAGVETSITFVDDLVHPNGYKLPFVAEEHQMEIRGNWKNWLTCLGSSPDKDGKKEECPPCKIGNYPSVISAYTIIDHSVWTDKKDKEHRDELKLFVAKSKTVQILDKWLAKYNTLRGLRFDVTRRDSKAPNVGDMFIPDEVVELKDDIQPFDYEAVFKPKSAEEIKDILGIYDEGEGDGKVKF